MHALLLEDRPEDTATSSLFMSSFVLGFSAEQLARDKPAFRLGGVGSAGGCWRLVTRWQICHDAKVIKPHVKVGIGSALAGHPDSHFAQLQGRLAEDVFLCAM
jgi:hypothetical protein